MLPQKNRVTTQEFKEILKIGLRISSENISISYVKNDNQFKASVVVSKKVSKKAVDRNYQKRRVREAIRRVFYPFTQKNSVVFFVKRNISKNDFSEIVSEVERLSKKIK